MLSTEAQRLDAHFAEMRESFRARIDAVEVATHRKLDALVAAVHHLLTRGPLMSDHASILADLKKFDADLDTAIDGAVSEFTAFEATHAATKESLDDIGSIVSGLPSKLDKLKAVKAPDDDAPTEAAIAAIITAVVTGPTTAPAAVIPVSVADATSIAAAVTTAVATGATVPVSGATIATGTTVLAADPVSATPTITLSQPTTADHTGDGTETLTVTPAPDATAIATVATTAADGTTMSGTAALTSVT